MARRRCSVETYSSPSDCASFWACCSTRPSRPEAESCTLPLTFGWRWSSVASAVESCAGWMPSAVSTLGTMPPAWSTSADAMCSTSSCAWPSSRAFCCAATSASCDFSVSLFGSITQHLQSGTARLLEEMAPDVLPAARRGDLARKLALFFVELRRHDDLDGAVEIPVAAARAGHPLPGKADPLPILHPRRDLHGESPGRPAVVS